MFTTSLFSDMEMTFIYHFMTQCWSNGPIIDYFLKFVWVPGKHIFLSGNLPFPLFSDIDQTLDPVIGLKFHLWISVLNWEQ